MSQRLKKTVRKLVTLSLDTAERVESYRERTGAASESDALRALVEGGLSRFDTPDDLFARCQKATASGQSVGDVIMSVTADHPLVRSTSVEGGSSDYNEPEIRFRFRRDQGLWSRQKHGQQDDDWVTIPPKVEPPGGGRPAAPRGGKDLDDDIPF